MTTVAMAKEKDTFQYPDEEATRRMNEAIRRALTSPPKPHSAMKLGKRKGKVSAKENPPEKLGSGRSKEEK
jgi:hypothetical protein